VAVLGEHREALQVVKAERQELAGHRQPPCQHVVPPARFKTLGHNDIFGAATLERYPGCSRTARSSASSASGLRERYSGIAANEHQLT